MTVYQKLMYVAVSFSVAMSVSMANYVFYPERLPDTDDVNSFYSEIQENNDKLLKHFFPYEIVDYDLEVPSNMTYTQAEFQKFKGTYLEKSTVPAGSSYLDKIAFCGDSLSYHMGMNGQVLDDYNVLAWGGLSVSDYATHTANPVYNQSDVKGKTTIQWLSELKPELIYIMLGTNGVSIYSNSAHVNLYKSLLSKIKAASPGSKIVIISSPPWGTDQTSSSTPTPELNAKIDQFNMLLLEMADSNGCYFLNLAEDLKDSAGNLKSIYSSGDGIHWSTAARQLYVNYVLEHPIPGF